MIEVVGIGAMNIDRLYQVEHILTDGEAMVKEKTALPGGSAANTIYGLARLGLRTGFVGVTGDDREGQMLLRDFQSVGIDTSGIKIKAGAETGSVLCLTDSGGRRALYVSPGANNLLGWADVSLDYLNQAKVIHLSSFVADEQFQLQRRLLDSISPSVKVSFAPGELYASKGWAALGPIIKRAHILFVNRQELKQLTGEGLEKGAQKCLAEGCHIVAITLGRGMRRRGKTFSCYLSDGGQGHMLEARHASDEPILDTTGAGDAFAAGFIYGFLKEKSLEECGLLGSTLASFSIARLGARSGLPSLPEMAQRYQLLYGRSL